MHWDLIKNYPDIKSGSAILRNREKLELRNLIVMILLTLFILIFIVLAIFTSRSISPIPYFPSNKKDIPGIVKMLKLQNDQIIYDLGAGDGIVIFAAATAAKHKKLNTQFIAVEINPVLLAILWTRRLLHPNRINIRIVHADIFSLRYALHATRYTIFAYISPWYLEKVFKNCKFQMRKFRFVSYFYPIPNLKPSRTIKGVHNTYIYNV